jgi:hypothetical protein
MALSKKTRQALKETPIALFKGARRAVFVDGVTEEEILQAIRAAAGIHEFYLANDIAARYNLEICCRCAWLESSWSALCTPSKHSAVTNNHWVRVCSGCALYIPSIALVAGDEGAGARLLEKLHANGEDIDDEDEDE